MSSTTDVAGAHCTCQDLADRWDLRKRTRSWGGRCPCCAYPGATFSIKPAKGGRVSAYCSNGCTRDQLNQAVQEALGTPWTGPAREDPKPEDVAARRAAKRTLAGKLWAGSSPIRADDPAGLYLASRGLMHIMGWPAMRYRQDCRHPEAGTHPALVAQVVDMAGEAVAVHRTYLTRDGRKANLDPVKCSLGPVWGGAIRLLPHPAPALAEIVVGEGIETSASAGLLLGLPAFAAVSCNNLAAGLVLPPGVSAVTIAADNDRHGYQAAEAAAARWSAEGRRVRIARPDEPGVDFNDLLRRDLEVPHA